MKLNQFLMLFVLLFAVHLPVAQAQQSDAAITLSKVVDASSDEVWSVIREMDNIDKLSSFVARVEWEGARGEGGQRTCYPPQGQEGFYREKILAFDDPGRNYTYTVLEGIPVRGMVSNFKVVDLGYQRSMIVWTSNYEEFMTNPQMTEEQFVGFINQAAGEMIANVAIAAED